MVKRIFVILCCLAFIALAFADVGGFVDAGRRGVLLFGRNVLPVLFPFFFVSGLLVEMGFFKVFKKGGVFAVSLLAGYPTGARLLGDLYNRGEITRTQAIRMATYTSTCSPIFVVATLGVCFYGSVGVGVLGFGAHALGAVVNGVLFHVIPSPVEESRLCRQSLDPSTSVGMTSDAISKALYSAIQNIFAVGGLIVVFFIATNLIGGVVFVSGLLEMTNGVYLASIASKSLIIPTAIVSFGGLCVAMQGFVFMKSFRMPFWFYLLYKVTHVVFAIGSIYVLGRIF